MDYRKLAEAFIKDRYKREAPFAPPTDISRGEVGILIYLCEEKDGALSGELAKELNLTSGRIAIALKSLERKGFVSRARTESDKRNVIVNITPLGRSFAQKRKEDYLAYTTRLFEFLGETDAKEYVRIMNRLEGQKRE